MTSKKVVTITNLELKELHNINKRSKQQHIVQPAIEGCIRVLTVFKDCIDDVDKQKIKELF